MPDMMSEARQNVGWWQRLMDIITRNASRFFGRKAGSGIRKAKNAVKNVAAQHEKVQMENVPEMNWKERDTLVRELRASGYKGKIQHGYTNREGTLYTPDTKEGKDFIKKMDEYDDIVLHDDKLLNDLRESNSKVEKLKKTFQDNVNNSSRVEDGESRHYYENMQGFVNALRHGTMSIDEINKYEAKLDSKITPELYNTAKTLGFVALANEIKKNDDIRHELYIAQSSDDARNVIRFEHEDASIDFEEKRGYIRNRILDVQRQKDVIDRMVEKRVEMSSQEAHQKAGQLSEVLSDKRREFSMAMNNERHLTNEEIVALANEIEDIEAEMRIYDALGTPKDNGIEISTEDGVAQIERAGGINVDVLQKYKKEMDDSPIMKMVNGVDGDGNQSLEEGQKFFDAVMEERALEYDTEESGGLLTKSAMTSLIVQDYQYLTSGSKDNYMQKEQEAFELKYAKKQEIIDEFDLGYDREKKLLGKSTANDTYYKGNVLRTDGTATEIKAKIFDDVKEIQPVFTQTYAARKDKKRLGMTVSRQRLSNHRKAQYSFIKQKCDAVIGKVPIKQTNNSIKNEDISQPFRFEKYSSYDELNERISKNDVSVVQIRTSRYDAKKILEHAEKYDLKGKENNIPMVFKEEGKFIDEEGTVCKDTDTVTITMLGEHFQTITNDAIIKDDNGRQKYDFDIIDAKIGVGVNILNEEKFLEEIPETFNTEREGSLSQNDTIPLVRSLVDTYENVKNQDVASSAIIMSTPSNDGASVSINSDEKEHDIIVYQPTMISLLTDYSAERKKISPTSIERVLDITTLDGHDNKEKNEILKKNKKESIINTNSTYDAKNKQFKLDTDATMIGFLINEKKQPVMDKDNRIIEIKVTAGASQPLELDTVSGKIPEGKYVFVPIEIIREEEMNIQVDEINPYIGMISDDNIEMEEAVRLGYQVDIKEEETIKMETDRSKEQDKEDKEISNPLQSLLDLINQAKDGEEDIDRDI